VLSEKLEMKLPNSYSQFLLCSNGGQPKRNHFLKKNINDTFSFDFFLNVFYGIGGNDTSYDLLTMFSIHCESIPDELLPIGDDGIGNIVCIGVDGKYYGKIFMWWEDAQVEEPNFENVELIAVSFKEFLEGF